MKQCFVVNDGLMFSNGPYLLEGSSMKITDIKIEVVKRDLPAAGLDSDLGRFYMMMDDIAWHDAYLARARV